VTDEAAPGDFTVDTAALEPARATTGTSAPTELPGTDGVPAGADRGRAGTVTERAAARRRYHKRRALEWVVVLGVAALVALALRTFVVQTFFVPSGSMTPTLQTGDRILVDKLPFVADSIHRGDIVVFRRVPRDTEHDVTDLVKRVVGLPGETISSKGDTIYINGHPVAEPWLPSLNSPLSTAALCPQSAYDIPKTHIPPGHYFVMGDCRGNSYDSRDWGTVPASYIIGKVFLVIWRHNHPWFHWF
jgi:signal peptidase I